MERKTFAGRLRAAADGCREFALRFIEEQLPPELRFRVRLNCSYDGNPLHADEVVYPEDSGAERARALVSCTLERVVETLWRQGRVPEWINLSVVGLTATVTIIEVLACGRYTANDELLYHVAQGLPPFHVLGPTLPVGWTEGQRFSIYHRASCTARDELALLGPHRTKIWSLDLIGRDFRDDDLGHLREMSNLEILELHDSALDGSGLAVLERLPKLRVLRIFASGDRLDVERAPRLDHLTNLDVVNPPARPWGIARWLSRLPALTSLRLESTGDLVLDGKLPRRMEMVLLSGAQPVGRSRLPSQVDHLSISFSRLSAAALVQWLDPIKTVGLLALRGTPVDDGAVAALLSRWRLRYLDLADTEVTSSFLRRVILANPTMRVTPHIDPGELKPEEVARLVEGQLAQPMRFRDFFGTTPATLKAVLVQPHLVDVADDWGDDRKVTPMWAITGEHPGGHLIVYDPRRHLWLAAERSGQSWSASCAASSLDGALSAQEPADGGTG